MDQHTLKASRKDPALPQQLPLLRAGGFSLSYHVPPRHFLELPTSTHTCEFIGDCPPGTRESNLVSPILPSVQVPRGPKVLMKTNLPSGGNTLGSVKVSRVLQMVKKDSHAAEESFGGPRAGVADRPRVHTPGSDAG